MINELLDLKKIGPKTKKIYEKIGIFKPSDLIYNLPRDYEVLGDIKNIIDLEVSDVKFIKASIVDKPKYYIKKHLKIVSVNLKDKTGIIKAIWFNSPYIMDNLKLNEELIFRGKVSYYKNIKTITQAKIWKINKYENEKNTISPIYNLTKGLRNDLIKDNIKEVLSSIGDSDVIEYLDNDYLINNNMLSLKEAMKEIHFPIDMNNLIKAHNRLAFEEFIVFTLALRMNNNKNEKGRDDLISVNTSLLNTILYSLPYKLTNDQNKCINDIINDINNKKRINRLIEGDVGSGKSIIAFIISILLADKNIQTAIMAPTEVLAIQHYNNLKSLIEELNINIKICLLTSSISKKDRKDILKGIKNNEIKIVIGTHAVYSSDVEYYDLGLIVIDEQHRFGVNQRKELEHKGKKVNVLSMSATPIPRTLSLLLYMGMDISMIKEKPANRVPIKNGIITPKERLVAYKKIVSEVLKGNKCYIICPSIEDNIEYGTFNNTQNVPSIEDNIEYGTFNNTQNVYDYKEIIDSYIKSINIDKKIVVKTLHGKMKSEEKENVINEFINEKIDILISTTVVEVGVDCKKATIILIEDAPRFGLATLHQLRGRVGRDSAQSYAIFVDTLNTDESKKRLNVLKNSNDGFYISECDLKLRGPGDIFGIKQSGNMDFKIADIYTDSGILKLASLYADKIVKEGNIYTNPQYIGIKSQLDIYLKNGYII